MQQVTLVSAEEKLLVALTGEIDSATSEDFYAEVTAMYLNDKKDIVFDCAGLEFIDSTTLGTFVRLVKKLKADGNTLKLINVSPRIRKIFEICTLDKLMGIE